MFDSPLGRAGCNSDQREVLQMRKWRKGVSRSELNSDFSPTYRKNAIISPTDGAERLSDVRWLENHQPAAR